MLTLTGCLSEAVIRKVMQAFGITLESYYGIWKRLTIGRSVETGRHPRPVKAGDLCLARTSKSQTIAVFYLGLPRLEYRFGW